MKLYKITYLGGFVWHGTQAEAKLGAKQIGGTFEQVDVPTDKDGLLAWLNENVSGAAEAKVEHDELEVAELRAVEAARPAPSTASRPITTHDIERHILDDTTSITNVEDIFAALGARFKSMANKVKGVE